MDVTVGVAVAVAVRVAVEVADLAFVQEPAPPPFQVLDPGSGVVDQVLVEDRSILLGFG